MPYGRGGAGNIWEATTPKPPPLSSDLEANHPLSNPTTTSSPTTTSLKITPTVAPQPHTQSSPLSPQQQPNNETTTAPPAYAHTGRGGAGNAYLPSELARKGHFVDSTASPSSSSPSATSPSTTFPISPATGTSSGSGGLAGMKIGRGGVGNLLFGKGAEEEKRVEREREEQGKEEEVRRRVEEGVNGPGGLAVPARARVREGEDVVGMDV